MLNNNNLLNYNEQDTMNSKNNHIINKRTVMTY